MGKLWLGTCKDGTPEGERLAGHSRLFITSGVRVRSLTVIPIRLVRRRLNASHRPRQTRCGIVFLSEVSSPGCGPTNCPNTNDTYVDDVEQDEHTGLHACIDPSHR